MQHVFRIALCACLCLQDLQATPLRSNTARQQCTIKKEDMLFSQLNNVLCVSQGARIIIMLFLNLPFEAGAGIKKKKKERPRMNFSLCLQKNMTLTSPMNVPVRAPLCHSKSRSQTPWTTINVTICCVLFLPAGRLPQSCPSALHGAAALRRQKLHQHRLCRGQRGSTEHLHCATGELQPWTNAPPTPHMCLPKFVHSRLTAT